MKDTTYRWNADGRVRVFEMAPVRGTHGVPYDFGETGAVRRVNIRDFAIGQYPVTGALWEHVMGADTNTSARGGAGLPLENVSWNDITRPGGFLDRLNASEVRTRLAGPGECFRLPTETEWEYAVRGGSHWRDGFQFSGSNDADLVAWYGRRHGDHTQPVGLKLPNQLGLFDMSGNVWEWCQDDYTPDVTSIPADGTAFAGAADERVLRGGCFNNWAIHCTVSKRYSIAPDFHDGCIGFRVVLGT
jgi:sulfatase modifying factor 1